MVVIDTNVLISAAISDRDPEAVILWIVAQPDWQWVASREILAEYRDGLARGRFRLPAEVLRRWFELLDRLTTIIEVPTPPDFPRDPKDAIFLACAVAAQADYLVTGDKDFAEARRILTTKIVSVAQFKKLVCGAGA